MFKITGIWQAALFPINWLFCTIFNSIIRNKNHLMESHLPIRNIIFEEIIFLIISLLNWKIQWIFASIIVYESTQIGQSSNSKIKCIYSHFIDTWQKWIAVFFIQGDFSMGLSSVFINQTKPIKNKHMFEFNNFITAQIKLNESVLTHKHQQPIYQITKNKLS